MTSPPQLLEAHAPDSFYERVQALEQGEVARLEGGVAVKRLALEDGRDAFRIGSPSRWASDGISFDGENHRTAEDAVRAAFRVSAESNDPDSLGGVTRLSRWAPLLHAGSEVRVQDWTLDGMAVVSPPDRPGQTSTVSPSTISRRSLFESDLEEFATPRVTHTWFGKKQAPGIGRRTRADMDGDGIPYERGRSGGPPTGNLDTSRGIFRKYDDDGLLVALKDPLLTGKNRRQAEREARARGLTIPTVG